VRAMSAEDVFKRFASRILFLSCDVSTDEDLVAKDKDVIVLRTFSKIYGMAGLRAGIAYGRPDLLDQLAMFGKPGNLSQGTRACAAASLKGNATILPERIATYQKNHGLVYEQMDKLGVAYVPTVGNSIVLFCINLMAFSTRI
jgi:histidinol-phosphate aminotransferase